MTDTFVQVLDNNTVVIVEGPTPAPTIVEVGLQGPAGASGSSTFLGLTDTPASFSGQGGRIVRVKSSEDALEFATVSGTGTVTSVGLSMPTQFTVSGSPVTTSGTLTAAWQTQNANRVLAGPTSGGAAAPTFRSLVDEDIPSNIVRQTRQVASGTGLTGGGDLSTDRTLSLTGQALAIHSLASNGIVARTAADTFTARTISAGANISVTNGDGVAGNPTIAVTGLATVATTGSASDLSTGTLPIARGGTGASTAAGARSNLGADNASNITSGALDLARLAQGGASTNQVMTWNGSQWAPANGGASTFLSLTDTPSSYSGQANKGIRVNAAEDALEFFSVGGGGTVTSVDVSGGTTGLTTSGGPITSAGTITLGGTLAIANGGTGATTAAAARTNLSVPPTSRAINTNNGITGGGDLSADRTLGLTGQALAFHDLNTNGIVARTGAGTVAARTISAGTNISVTNGDGVSGNPTIAVTGLAAVATSGSASDLTAGTLPIARGGTGANTAADARANLGTNDASNITTGSLALARIAQGGASNGQVLKWNGTQWAPAADETGGGGGGSSTFLGLTDTPSSYSGHANKLVRVNAAENALEFVAPLLKRPFAYSPGSHVVNQNLDGVCRTASGGTGSAVSAGTTNTIPTNGLDTSPTWVACDKGTTATGGARVFVGGAVGGLDGRIFGPTSSFYYVITAWFAVSHVPDATNDFQASIGFRGGDNHQTTAGGVFLFAQSGNANWIARTRQSNGGSFTDTNTGVSISAMGIIRVEIEWRQSQAVFKINGSTVATHTTNLPTERCSAFPCAMLGIAGTANRTAYYSDFLVMQEPL